MKYRKLVERWCVFEAVLEGREDKNPFVDYKVQGIFSSRSEKVMVNGFYDGSGIYIIRFMPSFAEEYHFSIFGTCSKQQYEGSFEVFEVKEGNHGPVRVRGYHFEYEDGTSYHPVGTTAYVWELQEESIQHQTLETLAQGYFNKIRFCIFPKHYQYNLHDPISYPYEGTPCKLNDEKTDDYYQLRGIQPGNDWDFTRFNPVHFQNIEKSIAALGELGIEADLILMHAYDRWGFSQMSPEQDDQYWRYVIARFSAYRNVWWSFANEYDLLKSKTVQDWERYAQIVLEEDPYHHLRSIHNCVSMYDHSRPWITHCSIQRIDVYKCAEYTDDYRKRYGKPVVLDEIAYEGNIDQGWGNISGQELVRRFWEASVRGGYATHGETFDRSDGVLWWSHGGMLYGESPERIKFLKAILDETPGAGLRQKQSWFFDEVVGTADEIGDSGYYIYYYGFNRPNRRKFYFQDGVTYKAEVIDTWNMTITDVGEYSGIFTIQLPGREYMAIRLWKVNRA